MKKTKKNKKRKNGVKKDLRGFLMCEEGRIEKKKIAKVGAGLVAVSLFVAGQQDDAAAHWTHDSYLVNNQVLPLGTGSHYSDSSHSTGGWC